MLNVAFKHASVCLQTVAFILWMPSNVVFITVSAYMLTTNCGHLLPQYLMFVFTVDKTLSLLPKTEDIRELKSIDNHYCIPFSLLKLCRQR